MENPVATDTLHSEYWRAHRDLLFRASCIALIVTAMSFAIRGNILGDLGKRFGLSNEQMGFINGMAFWGFGISIFIGGWLCDVVGMGRLLIFAVVGHAVAIVTTVLANGSNAYMMLVLGMLAFGLANGFVEAACNPLIATLYPDEKIKRLNRFHVWFPGGIVIGGLVSYGLAQSKIGGTDHNWQIQMLTMVIPLVIYGAMFVGKKFPATERSASGISMKEMFLACLTPLFIVLMICMTMSAATELVTGGWIPNILTFTTGQAGILFLVLVNGLMAIGRTFAGEIVHRISPIAMLIGSSTFGAIGIFLFTKADSGTTATIAAVIFAVGVCYFWPTMLGVTSERFPRTGAFGISLMGGIGSIATAIWNPIVGKFYDRGIDQAIAPLGKTKDALMNAAANTSDAKAWAEAQAAGGKAGLSVLLYLPIILLCVFIVIFLYDKSRGGYKKVELVQHQKEDDTYPVTNQA